MMTFDAQTFEFEIEGPRNLRVPPATLQALQDRHRRLPRIACVCREMRDHALRANSRIEISFSCGIFSNRPDPSPMFDFYQQLLEYKNMTGHFNLWCDHVSFKPATMLRSPDDFLLLPREDGDEDDDFRPDFLQMNAWRIWLFAGSGALATGARTQFEELVLAERDRAVTACPELARLQTTQLAPHLPHEVIVQRRWSSSRRSYRIPPA